jgi:peptide/nickel transport system permease protein
MGRSMRDGRAAILLVTERIPLTWALTVPALMLKPGIGIPAGICAAIHRGSLAGRIVMARAVAGFTVPGFVMGLTLVLVFAVQLGQLPTGRQDGWRHAILQRVAATMVISNLIVDFLDGFLDPRLQTGAIALTTLAVSILGDFLPDKLDPTLRCPHDPSLPRCCLRF